MGKSTNHLYATGGLAESEYETVLHIACEGAKGEKTSTDNEKHGAVNKVWAQFADREVYRVDGTLLKFTHGENVPNDEAGILKNEQGGGTCLAWAAFFADALSVHAITVNEKQLPSFKTTAALAQGSGGDSYLPSSGPIFSLHQLVEVPLFPGWIYDPSYGGNPYDANGGRSALAMWEDDHLLEFKQGDDWILNSLNQDLNWRY